MTEDKFGILKERVRKVLKDGNTVVVMGWHSRNHDAFTESLQKSQVVFFEGMPIAFPFRTGLVVFTNFAGKKPVARLKKDRLGHHNSPLGTNEIKQLLQSFKENLVPKEKGKVRGDEWISDYQFPNSSKESEPEPAAPQAESAPAEETMSEIEFRISLKPRILERLEELDIEVLAAKSTLARIEEDLKNHPELAHLANPPQV